MYETVEMVVGVMNQVKDIVDLEDLSAAYEELYGDELAVENEYQIVLIINKVYEVTKLLKDNKLEFELETLIQLVVNNI